MIPAWVELVLLGEKYKLSQLQEKADIWAIGNQTWPKGRGKVSSQGFLHQEDEGPAERRAVGHTGSACLCQPDFPCERLESVLRK